MLPLESCWEGGWEAVSARGLEAGFEHILLHFLSFPVWELLFSGVFSHATVGWLKALISLSLGGGASAGAAYEWCQFVIFYESMGGKKSKKKLKC